MQRPKGNRREKKMPDRDLGMWQHIFEWLKNTLPVIYAMGVSAAMAILRIFYDDHVNGKPTSWKALILEGSLCGMITLAMASGLEIINVPQSASQFAGGMVGLIGVMKVREIASRWLSLKTYGGGTHETKRK